MKDLCIILATVIWCYALHTLLNKHILPFLVKKGTKDVEKNPKWIMSELRSKYYGFQDMNIVIVDSKFGHLPRLRISKEGLLELLISDDVSTREVEEVGRLALIGKIKAKYGLFFPDKSTQWLSVLCYMLDGGNINENAVQWGDK